ncbi:hypothetical protein [Roseobacter sp. A03A-229]
MIQSDEILNSIQDLKEFAETNQHEGLIAGLKVALEAYINDATSDEETRKAALGALDEVN